MLPGGGINSRESAARAGWNEGGNLRRGGESNLGTWKKLLAERRDQKWESFSWLTVRALFESVNDLFAKYRPELIDERRARWMTAQRGRRPRGVDDLVVSRLEPDDRAFLVVGDTGEQDASQYAVAPLLTRGTTQRGPEGEDVAPEFLVIASDLIYPAGDINEYINGFYIPYRKFEKPIYALPGNHDWYDGLDGFMYHFCGGDPLPPEHFRATEIRPSTRLAQFLWRGSDLPKRQKLSGWRASRPWSRDATGAVQPAPYFAIDLGDLLLVCIDTGVIGTIDEEQALWLVEVSARRQQKVLLTGKPIYVDGAYHPCEISWQRKRDKVDPRDPRRFATVDDVVREPEFGYIAAIGGDVHNYQRYPIRIEEPGGPGRTLHYLVSGGGGAYLSPTHRIPPLEKEPRTEHKWPAGLSMPPDEETFDAIPEPGEAAGDPSAFRCYPRRGDSLAYSARRAGPRIFYAVQIAAVAFVAAVAILLHAAPLHSTGYSALAAVYGPLILAGIAFLGIKALAGRRKEQATEPDTAEPEVGDPVAGESAAKEPTRSGGMAAAAGFAAIAIFGLAAFGIDRLSDSHLLTSTRFSGIAAVALLVPFLIVGAIVAAHDLRGSTPSALPELAIAGAFAAAAAIQWPPGPIGDAPGWFVMTVGVAILMAVEMLALGAARKRWPNWRSGPAYLVLDSLLVVAAPVALAAALAENTASDRVALLGLAIAASGAYPAALSLLPWEGGIGAFRDGGHLAARVKAASAFLSVAAWITVAAILVHMIGDGWIAIAAIGAFSLLVILLVIAMLLFLLVAEPLRKRVSLCLVAAAATIGLKFVWWPLFVLAAVLLLVAALASVWRLRCGQLNADAAQTEIRTRLRKGHPTGPDAWPRSRELAGAQKTIFDLLYPYQWKSDRDQGSARTGTSSQIAAKLIAELSDSEDPPFFKNLLRFDLRHRDGPGGEDRELVIRCFGVTGYLEDESGPPLEDEISIPFHSRDAWEQSSAPALIDEVRG
jgi:calcineurin-like phosphoesterase family protein